MTSTTTLYGIREFELTEAECAEAVAVATEAAERHGDCNSPDFLDSIPTYARRMPGRLIAFMDDLRHDDRAVAAVIRGGWHDGLDGIRTPEGWREARTAKAGLVQDFLVALHGAMLGEVFSWHGQQDGSLVHDLMPTFADRGEQLGSGSETALLWHTEDAFHPCRADFVLLYSVRAKEDATSTLAWLHEGALGAETVTTLKQSKYVFKPDTSYTDYDTFDNRPVPLLSGDAEVPHLRADSVYYEPPEGERERAALDSLFTALAGSIVEVRMFSGDTLVLNNRRVVHGRSEFEAKYDGTDRWVKRVNVAEDLDRSRAYRCCADSRIVHLAPKGDHEPGSPECDRTRFGTPAS
jgi:Fe(II)/alpha-ketoglutarate-dependent arginine beta-hydroxylase